MSFKRIALASVIAALPFATQAADTALSTVVVKAAKDEVPAAQVDAARLLAARPATSDAASLLRDVPGVSLYGAGGVSSLPAIHGLADDRIRTKVDGMDLISACGNHMNPPLSYIDPTSVGSVKVFAGITPVSVGGDSIGGTILVDAPAPEFAQAGQGLLFKGEAGAFYRGNGNARGSNLAATIANEKLGMTYRGSTAQGGNYRAGGKFKAAGPAFINDGRSVLDATNWLSGDAVGSSMYETTNQSIGFALRHDSQLVELKYAIQDIPYQGFPNQRMDMTANDSRQLNLRYQGGFDWGLLEARVYDEQTRHKMNFLADKAFWYQNNAPGMPMDTAGANRGGVVKADILLSARDTLRLGGEYQRYRFSDWWLPSGTGGMAPNTFWDINDGRRDRYAVFAEWEARWTPRWLTQFGVRHETVKMDAGVVQGYKPGAPYGSDAAAFNAAERKKTDHNLDLTALASYTHDATRGVDFGYARKTRSPNLYERYAWSTGGMAMNMINMAGDGNGYVGNVALDPEVAHTLSATFHWHDAERKHWGLQLTPYVTYVQDYINARRCAAADGNGGACTLAAQASANNFVFLKYANQDARLHGLDIAGHFPLAGNTGFGSFSARGLLSYVRGKTASGADDNLYNIMPLNAKLAVEQRVGNWSNTAEAQFVAGKSDIAQIRNEIKTPGYALLNLRSSYTWKQARFDVGIDNVFDRLYYHPLGGAYVGQGTTMPPTVVAGSPRWGTAVPGMGRSLYAGVNVKF